MHAAPLFPKKTLATVLLLLIAALHTLVFTFFQLPESYAAKIPEEYLIYLKLISYTAAIGASLSHMPLTRRFGVKNVFLAGLLCNLIGLFLILLSRIFFEKTIFVYIVVLLAGLSLGLALLTVINSMITYLVWAYPKKLALQMLTLFIFLDLGIMLAPLFLNAFNVFQSRWIFLIFLIFLVLLSLFSVKTLFSDPSFSKRQLQLSKRSFLWKDLHYRLIFFVIGAIFYAAVQHTFSLWGEVYLSSFFSFQEANMAITLFWLFMILGQIISLASLYYLSLSSLFSFLSLLVVTALTGLYLSKDPITLVAFLMLGGLGCSALFPILLSSLETQIVHDSKSLSISFLPFIEMGSAFLLSGYLFGLGLVEISLVLSQEKQLISLPDHFYFAIWAMLGSLLIFLFLDMYGKARKKTK